MASLLLLAALLPCTAGAVQEFYGEGNVLIAVDMGAYKENDAVSCSEGTLGTLVWGKGAKTGKNTRPDFANRQYTVSSDVGPVKAPAYAISPAYTVGQTVLFPYYRGDDPDYVGGDGLTADEFPSGVFAQDGSPRFLIHGDCVVPAGGETWYYLPVEETEDGTYHPCVDFLEIECVAVTKYSTVGQFTGTIYSNRTGFDPADYMGAVELTDAERQLFLDTCDDAYTTQGRIFGDPAGRICGATATGRPPTWRWTSARLNRTLSLTILKTTQILQGLTAWSWARIVCPSGGRSDQGHAAAAERFLRCPERRHDLRLAQ